MSSATDKRTANIVNRDADNRALGKVFAEAIRFQRLVRRWTQADLAREWQVSRPLIAQIESGSRKITVSDLCQACATFDVDVFDLLFMPRAEHADKQRVWRMMTPLFKDDPAMYDREARYF